MNEIAIASKAGALYALTVFLAGFVLGTFRVLLVAPHFGETIAVILEAPLMLMASWYVCRWCVRGLGVRPRSRRDPRWAPSRSLC